MGERFDFSSLSVSSARFEQLVAQVTVAVRARAVHPVWLAVRRAGLATLTVGALLALAAWAPEWLRGTAEPSLSAHPVAEWAAQGEVPVDVDLLEVTR